MLNRIILTITILSLWGEGSSADGFTLETIESEYPLIINQAVTVYTEANQVIFRHMIERERPISEILPLGYSNGSSTIESR